MRRWVETERDRLSLVVVSRGTVEAHRARARDYTPLTVLVQTNDAASRLYEAYGSPMAVLVNPDGTIGSYLAPGSDAIGALVLSAATARRAVTTA